MSILNEAFVQVAQDHDGYMVHYSTKAGLGDIHIAEGASFLNAVSDRIFSANPQIDKIVFREEKGVQPLPFSKVDRSPLN